MRSSTFLIQSSWLLYAHGNSVSEGSQSGNKLSVSQAVSAWDIFLSQHLRHYLLNKHTPVTRIAVTMDSSAKAKYNKPEELSAVTNALKMDD